MPLKKETPVAKKAIPKVPSDISAIAGLGVELSVISEKLDQIAARVGTTEKRLDEAKMMPLHIIQTRLETEAIRAAVSRIESSIEGRKWWRFWS